MSSALDSTFYCFRRKIFIGHVFFHVFVVSPPTWYLSCNTGSGTTAESGKSTVTSLLLLLLLLLLLVVVVVVVAAAATAATIAVIIIQFRQISTVLEV